MNTNTTYNIYVINIKNRTDRWKRIQESFSNFKSVKLIRSDAIKTKDGAVGCALSHIKLIKMAKNENIPYIIVFEDDTSVDENFEERFLNLMNYLENNLSEWDIFNGNPNFKNNAHLKRAKPKVINGENKIFSISEFWTTNFIIYNNSVYQKIINHEDYYKKNINRRIPHKTHSFDVILKNIKILGMVPYISTQFDSFSNLVNKYTDFSKEIKNWGKTIENDLFKNE